MTLNNIFAQWRKQKERQVKKTSMSNYLSHWYVHIKPDLGDVPLENLNKKYLTDWLYNKMEAGISKKYCIDLLIVLKMMMRYASEEYDVLMPDTHWKMVWPTDNQQAVQKMERYTTEESKKIATYIQANPQPRNVAILVALCTGLRIGEVCGLKWSDVDIDNKQIHVRRTIERYYDYENHVTYLVENTPKTVSSNRIVPIVSQVLPMLKNFKKAYREDYYLCTCTDKPTEPRTLRNYYAKLILEKVKLDHCIKFHGLRHTFASTLIENKVDVKTASVLLGHADVTTTMNIYVHPTDDAKRNAVKSGLKAFFK